MWYLTAVKHYPLYGYTMFPVHYKGFWSYPSRIHLAIGVDGINFVNQKTKMVRNTVNSHTHTHTYTHTHTHTH